MDWKEALSNLALPDDGADPESSTPNDTPAKAPVADTLLIELDRKGRRGKDATIISGFTIDDSEVSRIASQLKSQLGTGGSARGGEILIQGDRRDSVAAALKKLGFKIKLR